MLLYSLILKLVEAMTSIKIIITCGAAVLLLCVFDFSVFTACLERTPGHYVPSASARNPPRPILASENPTACITQSVCLKVSANGCVVLFQPIFCPCFMLKKNVALMWFFESSHSIFLCWQCPHLIFKIITFSCPWNWILFLWNSI